MGEGSFSGALSRSTLFTLAQSAGRGPGEGVFALVPCAFPGDVERVPSRRLLLLSSFANGH